MAEDDARGAEAETGAPEAAPPASSPSPPPGRGVAARAAWTGALAVLVDARDAFLGVRRSVNGFLARLDPCEVEGAEPLTTLPLAAFALALGYSTWLFWRSRFQPMQDLGHHIALSAVVADYHRPGSLYPALYEEPSIWRANVLLYFIAGYMGRVVGVVNAVRLCVTFYLVGCPVAMLYALRVFGRSAWPALLSVALVYNFNFVAGFANHLFAAPFMIIQVPLFYLMLHAPSWKRVAAVGLVFVLAFLSHAQTFLWTGVLCFLMTLVAAGLRLGARGATLRQRAVGFLRVAGVSFASVVPSFLVFVPWYQRTFGEGREAGGVGTATTATADTWFGAYTKAINASFIDLGNYALKVFGSDDDLWLMAKLAVICGLAIAFLRMHRLKTWPVVECACIVTFASYFWLPESIQGQDVIASRQMATALLLVAPFAAPIPATVSRAARFVVVAGIGYFTYAYLTTWSRTLYGFEEEVAAPVACVLDGAPRRLRLHFVKLSADTNKFFQWKSTWHVEKFYMGDKFGEVADNPAINSTSPIRFRAGVDPHRITTHPWDWWKMPAVWDDYDLVLVHGPPPQGEQLSEIKEKAVRLKDCKDWQLWRKHGGWETGAEPIEPP